MAQFSNTSKTRLATADQRLQRVFNEVIRHFDCTILEGHRSAEKQNQLLTEGKTQVPFPKSKHNSTPSKAIDAVPYPINWDDRERQTLFAGFVLGIATSMGITLRWGGDWDRDTEVKDNSFDDLVHFELVEER